VDRRELAEHLAGTDLPEAHRLAGEGIHDDLRPSAYQEEHLAGLVANMDDRLAPLVRPKGAEALEPEPVLGRQALEDLDIAQCVLRQLTHGSTRNTSVDPRVCSQPAKLPSARLAGAQGLACGPHEANRRRPRKKKRPGTRDARSFRPTGI